MCKLFLSQKSGSHGQLIGGKISTQQQIETQKIKSSYFAFLAQTKPTDFKAKIRDRQCSIRTLPNM